MELLWVLILALLPSLGFIAVGLIYIFKKDWAWRLYEWPFRDINPQRRALWEDNITPGGIVMIVAGIGLAVFTVVKFLSMFQGR